MVVSGSSATQWRFQGRFVEEEGSVASAGGGGDVLVARVTPLNAKKHAPPKEGRSHDPGGHDSDPTLCQGARDRELGKWLVKHLGGDTRKAVMECVNECATDPPANCLADCLTPKVGALAAGIANYAECCYSLCESTDGSFTPPGPCEKWLR
ncbi:MAG: hypothetical protein KGJ62_12945 [Armatimonadetes bacterium]|nr:hypothetical protein [Armatimonadota bacterium]MDE2208016.1 hypothetical protein [Armatimonadota bacterium]